MPAPHTIQKMQLWASDKGGKCLSKEYWNVYTKLTWMCAKGHTWDTMPLLILQGSWCPACSGRQKGTIEQMQELAMQRGGKCLSEKYINSKSKLKWQCIKGHIWSTSGHCIKSGNWCLVCSGKQKGTIEQMQELAMKRRGKCLSEKYINNRSKLKWQCIKGHIWNTSAHDIKIGNWCPYCYGNARHTLEEMKQIAKERGGQCLSKTYINKETPLKWKCAEGHIWQARPGSIRLRKSWCPVCARKKIGIRHKKYTIEEMKQIAKERKGKCLSKKYVNVDTHMKWKCARGHVWNARAFGILHHGSWCKKCRYIDRSTRHTYHQNPGVKI